MNAQTVPQTSTTLRPLSLGHRPWSPDCGGGAGHLPRRQRAGGRRSRRQRLAGVTRGPGPAERDELPAYTMCYVNLLRIGC